MPEKTGFALQALLITVLFNAALLAAVYFIGGEALQGKAVAVFGVGALLTLALWFALRQVSRRFTGSAAPAEATPRSLTPAAPDEASALQLLAILQRKGRLIDFLHEDLRAFDDAQIGAAVRSIHAGCSEALAEHVELAPVMQEAEGSAVTVAPGFDAQAVRLTGNVVGDPPFKGALRHRGWRVVRVNLPARMPGQGQEKILAAAEVEVTA